MPLYALQDLDDALDATRAFLWPLDRSRWLKLALVVFFVGGPAANVNAFRFDVPVDGGPPPAGGPLPLDVGPRTVLLIGAVVAVALLVGLALLLVGSIMEFVLIESLAREAVMVRDYWGRRWRQGVRLFGFRLAIGLVVIGSVAVLLALFLVPMALDVGPGVAPTGVSGIVFLLLVPVVLVLGIVVGLVNGFTTAFVVPIMIAEDCGVLDGWRRLWPTITAQPGQYLAYAVAGFLLAIAGGILVALAIGVGAVVLLIPFGLLAAVGFLLFTVVEPVGLAVFAIVGVLFGLSVLVLLALARVPVVAYLRYYALFVLGDVDPGLDLVAERRAAIRTAAD